MSVDAWEMFGSFNLDSPETLSGRSPSSLHRQSAEELDFLATVGERLRLLRLRRGMTRRALSKQSGVSERYIAQMEAGNGNVSILLLRDLAKALAVATTALLDDAPEKPADLVPLESFISQLRPLEREEAHAMLLARFGETLSATRHERLALIGLRGAGKSSLGAKLAEHLRYRFVELDREIEREAGVELREIFELHGQRGFRRLERAVLERLTSEPPGIVIATGGSIVAEPATFEWLLSRCLTIWIRASPEEHMQRVIEQGDLRPMQDNKQSMADLRAILASREALYTQADLTLDTTGQSFGVSLANLINLLDIGRNRLRW